MQSKVLSDEDLVCFEQNGYVRLPEAFLRADALAIQDSIWTQMQDQGIGRKNRSSWPAGSWQGVKDHPSLERGIAAPRLREAIDQLAGADNWRVPARWGGFLISFPEGKAQEWQLINRGWHWDDTLLNHFGKRNTALFIFTLFSDIQAGGGGTLIVSGSHRLLEQFYHHLSPEDRHLKQKALKNRFARSRRWLSDLTGPGDNDSNRVNRFMQETAEVDGVPVKVVEMKGEAGDAYLCHPAIYHAASLNHGDGPRFMRGKGLLRHAKQL